MRRPHPSRKRRARIEPQGKTQIAQLERIICASAQKHRIGGAGVPSVALMVPVVRCVTRNEKTTPTEAAKISTSEATTIERCEGAMSKIHSARRTVNHSERRAAGGPTPRPDVPPAPLPVDPLVKATLPILAVLLHGVAVRAYEARSSALQIHHPILSNIETGIRTSSQ
jgi:hypothetical protein